MSFCGQSASAEQPICVNARTEVAIRRGRLCVWAYGRTIADTPARCPSRQGHATEDALPSAGGSSFPPPSFLFPLTFFPPSLLASPENVVHRPHRPPIDCSHHWSKIPCRGLSKRLCLCTEMFAGNARCFGPAESGHRLNVLLDISDRILGPNGGAPRRSSH